jgi:endonuclease-3
LGPEFLRDWPLPAKALRALNGVGPKTAACVLMFTLGGQLPVDTHNHRVAQRLALFSRATAEKSHDT